MQPARSLRNKLDDGKIVIGALATFHVWPDLVEMAIDAGLDYLIVDLEHGPHDISTVAQVCQLGRVANFAVLIRSAANDFRSVGYAMDLGPCGLVLAAVESAAQLDEVRDAIYMPPRGRRRPGGLGNRWVDDYQCHSWRKQVEDDVIIVPQIETRAGLDQADAVAKHEIVTAIGIGPYDLSMAVGADMDSEHDEYVAAVKKIRLAGDAASKTMWLLGDVTQLVREGFRFLCAGEVTVILAAAIRQHVESVK